MTVSSSGYLPLSIVNYGVSKHYAGSMVSDRCPLGYLFEYPQHMFWMRNKENSFPICTLIWMVSTLTAQSVTCLATDASLTADLGIMSSIWAQSHTFVEIDHEIIYTVILLPSAESFKKGCCQLQAKVCARSTG